MKTFFCDVCWSTEIKPKPFHKILEFLLTCKLQIMIFLKKLKTFYILSNILQLLSSIKKTNQFFDKSTGP